jgi:hypothetical protein
MNKLLDSDGYLRVVGLFLEAGDDIEFDVTGTDLGTGFTDVSCHVAWYVEGEFLAYYNGGSPHLRISPSIGCVCPTEPNDHYTYPTGKARAECVKPGHIYMVEQSAKENKDQWQFALVDGEFTGSGYLIHADGTIESLSEGVHSAPAVSLHIQVK